MMSRLTKSGGKFVSCNIDDECTGMCGSCKRNTEIRHKLRYYEDLEEQGRLIELPCLPDEEVWISNKRFGTHKTMYASRGAIVDTKEAAESKLAEMDGTSRNE